MTTSSLHHTQGIRGYKYQKTERTADCEIYYLHSEAKQQACPQCRSWHTSIVETGKTRDIRGLCIGFKKR
jgi:Zn finger protein HypA/HybF involved in hydrogenase expression